MNKLNDVIFLKKLASNLGNDWIYNDILSNESKHIHNKILNNRSGLYLKIGSQYGKTNPQIKLGYINQINKCFVSCYVIGCSLEKNFNSIVNDIKNRLLLNSSKVYQALKESTEKNIKEINSKNLKELELNALRKVIQLNDIYNHRGIETYRLEDDKGSRYATLKKSYQSGYDLELDNLTVEQIIKIMQIVKPN